MIRSEPLTEFVPGTEQLLFPYAAEEFLRAGALRERLLKESEQARVIYQDDTLLCYAGIVRASFVDKPFLWLLLGRNFSRACARTFKKLSQMLRDLYPRVYTVVECSYSAGHRFARFCGFRPMGIYADILGRKFEYYEVI